MVDRAGVQHQALPLRRLAHPVGRTPGIGVLADVRDVVRANLVAHHARHVEGSPVVAEVLNRALRACQFRIPAKRRVASGLVRRLVRRAVLRKQHVNATDEEGEARAELLREWQPEAIHVDIRRTIEGRDQKLRRSAMRKCEVDRSLCLRRGFVVGPFSSRHRWQTVSTICGGGRDGRCRRGIRGGGGRIIDCGLRLRGLGRRDSGLGGLRPHHGWCRLRCL